MTSEAVEQLLRKLTHIELKALAKRLNISLKHHTKKEQAVEKILLNGPTAAILKQLGIEKHHNSSESESLSIARKSLENQKRQRIITTTGVIVGSLGVLIAFLTFLMNFSTQEVESDLGESKAVSSLFQEGASYNILLLPFGSSQRCSLETVICEREVEERFNLLKRKDNSLDIEVQVYEGINTTKRSLDFDKARALGDSLGADLVVWGDYLSKCKWDSTKISVKWVATTTEEPFLDPEIDTEYRTIQDFSRIVEGEITGNVEEIVYWVLGQREKEEKNYAKALHYFYKIDTKDIPEYSKVFAVIGYCLFSLNTDDGKGSNKLSKDSLIKSIQYLSQAIKLDTANMKAYNGRGASYSFLENHKAAVADYSAAIRLKPGEAFLYTNRGQSFLNLQRYEEAIADFSKAIELNPDSSKTYVAYANRAFSIYSMLRNQEKRPLNIECLLEQNPIYFTKNKGKLYVNLPDTSRKSLYLLDLIGRYTNAITDYSKAINLKPDDPRLYFGRGQVNVLFHRPHDAIKDFSKVIILDSTNYISYALRGEMYYHNRDFDKAIPDLSKFIAMQGGNTNAYYFRGVCFTQLQEFDKAINDLTQSIELDSNNGGAFEIRGATYWAIGEFSKAIDDLTASIQLNPANNGIVHYNRGKIYAEMGLEAKAQADFKKARKLGYDHDL